MLTFLPRSDSWKGRAHLPGICWIRTARCFCDRFAWWRELSGFWPWNPWTIFSSPKQSWASCSTPDCHWGFSWSKLSHLGWALQCSWGGINLYWAGDCSRQTHLFFWQTWCICHYGGWLLPAIPHNIRSFREDPYAHNLEVEFLSSYMRSPRSSDTEMLWVYWSAYAQHLSSFSIEDDSIWKLFDFLRAGDHRSAKEACLSNTTHTLWWVRCSSSSYSTTVFPLNNFSHPFPRWARKSPDFPQSHWKINCTFRFFYYSADSCFHSTLNHCLQFLFRSFHHAILSCSPLGSRCKPSVERTTVTSLAAPSEKS